MSRELRRQRALALPAPCFRSDGSGACWAFAVRGDAPSPRVSWRALTLAAEVRNGVRWPWLDPCDLVKVLRGGSGLALGLRHRGKLPECQADSPAVRKLWAHRRDAARWLAALELTPRERAELLAYLTRGYL